MAYAKRLQDGCSGVWAPPMMPLVFPASSPARGGGGTAGAQAAHEWIRVPQSHWFTGSFRYPRDVCLQTAFLRRRQGRASSAKWARREKL